VVQVEPVDLIKIQDSAATNHKSAPAAGGSVAQPKNFCVLSEIELDNWRFNDVPPNCKDHRHQKRSTALEMCGITEHSHYKMNIAELVGPHHVRMLLSWTWAVKKSGGEDVLQLVRGAAPIGGPKSRFTNAFTNERTRTLCRCGKCDR
jgi:hypothetical protein